MTNRVLDASALNGHEQSNGNGGFLAEPVDGTLDVQNGALASQRLTPLSTASQGLTPQQGSGTLAAREEVDLVREAVTLLLAAGGEPFCDLQGRIRLRRPKAEGTRRTMMEFPVKSERTASWMARLMFDHHLPALCQREQTQALFVLQGLAIDNEDEVECADMMDGDIVFHALADLMHVNPEGWAGTATRLLADLKVVANANGICGPRDARWPKDPSHLTIQVRKQLPWLEEIGLVYDYGRVGDQRVHCFRYAVDVEMAGDAGGRRQDATAKVKGKRRQDATATTGDAEIDCCEEDLETCPGEEATSSVARFTPSPGSRREFPLRKVEQELGVLRAEAEPATEASGNELTKVGGGVGEAHRTASNSNNVTVAAPVEELVTGASGDVAVGSVADDSNDTADTNLFNGGSVTDPQLLKELKGEAREIKRKVSRGERGQRMRSANTHGDVMQQLSGEVADAPQANEVDRPAVDGPIVCPNNVRPRVGRPRGYRSQLLP